LHALRQLRPSLNKRHRRHAPQLARLDLIQPAAVVTPLAALDFLTMPTRPTFRAKFKLAEGGTNDRDRAPSSWLVRHGGSATRSTLERHGEKRPWPKIATVTVAA